MHGEAIDVDLNLCGLLDYFHILFLFYLLSSLHSIACTLSLFFSLFSFSRSLSLTHTASSSIVLHAYGGAAAAHHQQNHTHPEPTHRALRVPQGPPGKVRRESREALPRKTRCSRRGSHCNGCNSDMHGRGESSSSSSSSLP